MNRIVVFPQTISPEIITTAFPNHDPLIVYSKAECAETLVSESGLDALFIQRDSYGREYRSFLSSVKQHFPLLEVAVIAPKSSTPPPDGCHFIDSSSGYAAMVGQLASIAQTCGASELRRRIRFDWPLNGRLSVAGQDADCKVRAFSSAGAFLETDRIFEIGAKGTVRVEFLNSRMAVACEVVRRRAAQTGEPAGYGVSFVDLQAAALDFCDRIVHDAVVQALLFPDQERAAPALSDDDLLIPGFDRI